MAFVSQSLHYSNFLVNSLRLSHVQKAYIMPYFLCFYYDILYIKILCGLNIFTSLFVFCDNICNCHILNLYFILIEKLLCGRSHTSNKGSHFHPCSLWETNEFNDMQYWFINVIIFLTPIPILMSIQMTMLIILVVIVHPLTWATIVIIASFVTDTIIDINADVN